jgi:Tol biopolymer transport system component/DNA-binding winged helix-turn-helix (wHTH) protein
MGAQAKHFYEFGPFRVDVEERLLLLDGQVVGLTPKAFDTLLVLVRNRGRMLGREELMRQVWPDSFVEEANLTVNISTLRKALGERPHEHRYIATVPGRGYRFMADVRERWEEPAELIVQEQTLAEITIEEEEESEGRAVTARFINQPQPDARLSRADGFDAPAAAALAAFRPRRRSRATWLAVFVTLAAAAGGAFWAWSPALSKRPASVPRLIPLTSFPGLKGRPAFSPGGDHVAFLWDADSGGAVDLYVKLIAAGTPLRLTSDPAAEASPVWSHDGLYLAFTRPSAGRRGIHLVPALGGAERKLAEVAPSAIFAGRMSIFAQDLDWSPDGKLLAAPDRSSADAAQGIFLISAESGEKRRLTSPPTQYLGDWSPKFSPDGKTLAFVRGASFFVNDLYFVPTDGGEARQLTFDHRWILGLTWTADGREIIFSSNRGGLFRLWRVAVSGGAPEAMAAAGEDAYLPSVSRRGNRLAYVRWKPDSNIWRVAGPNAAHDSQPVKPPVKLIASTREEALPQFSPDGQRIAFLSNRSGSDEIWVCDGEGQHPIQLTSFGGPQGGTPRWSPDGRRIVFDCRPEGHADIFVIGADGGLPRRLTTEASEDIVPSWSRDGRWVYFVSNRGGTQQVWKVAAEGGQPVQVTRQGGFEPFESADGQWLYYVKQGGLWRMPAAGGEEARILDRVEWGYWAECGTGICFLDRQATPRPAIEFIDLTTRQTRRLADLEKESGLAQPPGFAVSPDGRWILYKRVDQIENDLLLVENFR